MLCVAIHKICVFTFLGTSAFKVSSLSLVVCAKKILLWEWTLETLWMWTVRTFWIVDEQNSGLLLTKNV